MPRGWGAARGGTTGIRLGPNNYFKSGTWNAYCWTCGIPGKADEMQKLSVYDGSGWVCRRCFELPNPQNFVRGIPDRQNVPWVQNYADKLIGPAAGTPQFPQRNSNMTGAAMTGSGMTG